MLTDKDRSDAGVRGLRRLARRPSASMVVAIMALVLAASGTAVAAGTLVNGNKLIKKNSLSGNRLRKHTITGTQVNLKKLGTVPNAKNAKNAKQASNANNANNAANLGGQAPSAYMPATAVQRPDVVTLTPGTTGKQILVNGPLSFTADCSQSGGVTTVTLHQVSTVGNWLDYSSVQAAPGSVNEGSLSDGGSTGTESGSYGRIDMSAPGGQTIHGQVTYGVNWPSAGECFVNAYGVN